MFYTKTGVAARLHLFRVTSGLDSMVIGESQIMGQIRTAYALACSSGVIGPLLHKEIQEALRVAKKVRNLTAISRGVTSVPGVVTELIKKKQGLRTKSAGNRSGKSRDEHSEETCTVAFARDYGD